MPPFAVEQRHVDVEEAEEGVDFVFGAGGVAVGCPGHFLCRGEVGEVAGGEVGCADLGDVDDEVEELVAGADLLPAGAVEVDDSGRDEFLERPTSGEPA